MGGNIIKINKTLLFISIIFVSLICVSAVSAADDMADEANVIAVDSDDEIVSVDESDIETADDGAEVLAADDADEIVAVEEEDPVTFGSGNGTKFDFSSLFNGTNITFGNGSSFDLGSLFNGTTISFGNGTSFNTSSLLNANFTFGNGSSFNISSFIGGNGTSFDISGFANMFGGSKETITATDVSKTYTTYTKFSAKVMKGNQTLTTGTVIFTIDNKEYTGRIGSDGVASVTVKNLKAGEHFVITEYGGVMVKNVITVKKATPKLTAKNKAFKVKTKVKKYTVTLKTNENKALKKVKVTIKVKGKTYVAKTNSYGKATFKITKLVKKGKFSATVKFAANSCFKSVSKKVKITVK